MIILSVWLCPYEWLSRLCGMFAIAAFLYDNSICLGRLCVCYRFSFVMTIIHLHCQSVRFHVKSWLPARSIVLECLLSRGNIDPSGEIMVLDRFCPVKSRPFCVISNWISPISTTEFFGSVSKFIGSHKCYACLVVLFYHLSCAWYFVMSTWDHVLLCCKNRHLKIVAPPKRENTWFVL